MPQYLSPGVYVEEVPGGVQPIAGVGTSTAGFIGLVPDVVPLAEPVPVVGQVIGPGTANQKNFVLPHSPVVTEPGSFEARVDGAPRADAILENDQPTPGQSRLVFDDPPPGTTARIEADYMTSSFRPVPAGEVRLCTTFSEFRRSFGDFSTDPDQNRLAHAVYGFFNNHGTRCYVARVEPPPPGQAPNLRPALERFETVDEIALVAAPGVTAASARADIVAHCLATGDRFAILDSAEQVETEGNLDLGKLDPPDNSDYAAFYFPWIEVFDPVRGGGLHVPPSGHVAGVYARVDTQRGVHKAPANETVLGALGLKYNLSRAKQAGLNPQGVNCIRDLNGNIRIWGARTIGGDANGEWKYVNVRRLFLFLRESIDEGTQWVVFEPNDSSLWSKITRNVTAFLTNVWRSGALLGSSPQEAFFVKCDAETNPQEVRDAGQVVTEIGVAVVKPAEFVIFRISQWAGAGG